MNILLLTIAILLQPSPLPLPLPLEFGAPSYGQPIYILRYRPPEDAPPSLVGYRWIFSKDMTGWTYLRSRTPFNTSADPGWMLFRTVASPPNDDAIFERAPNDGPYERSIFVGLRATTASLPPGATLCVYLPATEEHKRDHRGFRYGIRVEIDPHAVTCITVGKFFVDAEGTIEFPAREAFADEIGRKPESQREQWWAACKTWLTKDETLTFEVDSVTKVWLAYDAMVPQSHGPYQPGQAAPVTDGITSGERSLRQ